MLNPTENSWILPIRGDGHSADATEEWRWIIRQQGLKITAEWQPAVTFNELNGIWWTCYFMTKTVAELRLACELLDVEVCSSKCRKADYVEALSAHYKARFQ